MPGKLYNRLAIVGFGLIGSSIARIAREKGVVGEIVAIDASEKHRERIVALMTEDAAIKGVHQLRTRASGPYVHIQMHADLDPGLSLVAAHDAVVAAEKRVLTAFPAADIIIHADPRGQAEPHGGAFAETTH